MFIVFLLRILWKGVCIVAMVILRLSLKFYGVLFVFAGTKDERWSMEGRRACVDFHAIKVLTPVSQTERGSDSASKEAQRYFKV